MRKHSQKGTCREAVASAPVGGRLSSPSVSRPKRPTTHASYGSGSSGIPSAAMPTLAFCVLRRGKGSAQVRSDHTMRATPSHHRLSMFNDRPRSSTAGGAGRPPQRVRRQCCDCGKSGEGCLCEGTHDARTPTRTASLVDPSPKSPKLRRSSSIAFTRTLRERFGTQMSCGLCESNDDGQENWREARDWIYLPPAQAGCFGASLHLDEGVRLCGDRLPAECNLRSVDRSGEMLLPAQPLCGRSPSRRSRRHDVPEG